MLSEVEGQVEGHQDGHGFVRRDDGGPTIYLSPQEMRAVLHRDRVRVRIVRYDRKGRPEGRVLDIVERRKAPIIGRLLHDSAGVFEDQLKALKKDTTRFGTTGEEIDFATKVRDLVGTTEGVVDPAMIVVHVDPKAKPVA